MAVYLRLFHGRETLDQHLDDWGTDGPVLGPLPYVQVTYCSEIKIGDDYEPIPIIKDLAKYKGVYYGDWSIFDEENPDVTDFHPEEPEPRDTDYVVKYRIPNGDIVTIRDSKVLDLMHALSNLIKAHTGPDGEHQKTIAMAQAIIDKAWAPKPPTVEPAKPDPVQLLLASVKGRPDVLAFVRDIYGVDPE